MTCLLLLGGGGGVDQSPGFLVLGPLSWGKPSQVSADPSSSLLWVTMRVAVLLLGAGCSSCLQVEMPKSQQ